MTDRNLPDSPHYGFPYRSDLVKFRPPTPEETAHRERLIREAEKTSGLRDIKGNPVNFSGGYPSKYSSRELALHYQRFGYPGDKNKMTYNEGDQINCTLTSGETVTGKVLGYIVRTKEGVQIVVETSDKIKEISTTDITN